MLKYAPGECISFSASLELDKLSFHTSFGEFIDAPQFASPV